MKRTGARNIKHSPRLWRNTIATVSLLFCASCSDLTQELKPRSLTYFVHGTSRTATITYLNDTNGTDRVTTTPDKDGHVSWKHSFLLKPGAAAYISAQCDQATASTATGLQDPSIAVEVLDYGSDPLKIVKSAESHGAYAIATISGSLD